MRTVIALFAFVLAASAATYTLQAGDTLGGVAKKHGVSVASLAAANGIANPNRVYAGQVLKVPGGAPTAKHVVRSGETLGAIAKRYRTTVAALAKANGITNPNRIRIGQVLAVPGGASWVCPVSGRVRFANDFGVVRSDGRLHDGVDIFAARGTPVVASVSGSMTRRDGPRAGLAYYLKGDDGLTYYGAHLATFVRGEGRVRIGQLIGTVGNTGNARGTSPHLHFEIIDSKGPKSPHPTLASHCPRAR